MPEIEEEGPSEIKGQQNPPPTLKKRKIEGGEEEKYGADSIEEDIQRRHVIEYPEWAMKLMRSYPPSHDESDTDSDYLADGETKVDWALWDEYSKQSVETEGFGLKVDPGCCFMASMRPVLNFKESDYMVKLTTEFSDLAIKEYNKNNVGKEFKLVDVEWVVAQLDRGTLYLLTFKAEDAQEGVKTFEAKVLDGIMDEKPKVDLCRLKKQTDA